MSVRKVILFTVAVSVLAGCTSYPKLVKKELKVPYVYIPPNNQDHPYTLIHSTKDGNFQSACTASLLTGLSEEKILMQRKESSTSTIGIKNNASATFDVKVGKAEIGELDLKYTRINKVEMTLTDGKVVTLPGVSLSKVVNNIADTYCKDDIQILVNERPDSKFYIPLQLYAYNIQYHIYTEDGVDVTAELPKEITNIVLAKAGVGYKATNEVTMSGSNLYIGFRGTPITATLATMLDVNNNKGTYFMLSGPSLVGLKDEVESRVKVVDVTEFVKEVAADK